MYRPSPFYAPRLWHCGACNDARDADQMRRCSECDTLVCAHCEREDGSRCAVCVIAEEMTHDAQ